MVTTDIPFNDEMTNPTQLKRNWSHWISRVRVNPVTIYVKDEPITMIRRKDISELTKKLYYTHLLVQFCQGYIQDRTSTSSILPWVTYLSDREKKEFFMEFLNAYNESYSKDDWYIIQEVLDDWKATAEVKSNPKLVELLEDEGDPSEYVKLER